MKKKKGRKKNETILSLPSCGFDAAESCGLRSADPAAGAVIGQTTENPVTGSRQHREFSEDGTLKYSLQEEEGFQYEVGYDEEGYCVLYFQQDERNTMNGSPQNVSYWAQTIGCRS